MEIVTERRQTLLHVWEPCDLADLLAETLDDVAGRLGRSCNGEPDADVESGERVLRDGRHLRENGDALRGCGCERLHLARLDELNDGVGRRPDQRDLSAEQIVERGRRAAIRHVGDVDLGGTVEHGGGEMVWRTDAGRAYRQLAWIGFGIGDQFLHVRHRQRRMREQQERRGGHLRHRREILDHVERHALVQPLVENGGNVQEQERAAVGRGLGGVIDTRHTARSHPVLDHDRLLEPLLQPLGERAADGVHAAAGRDRHDQRDWARGIACGRLRVERSNDADRNRENGGHERASRAHSLFLPVPRPCYRAPVGALSPAVTVTRRRFDGKRRAGTHASRPMPSRCNRYGKPAPTVSAMTAPRPPSGLAGPTVVSCAVWCSISELSSAPTSTTMVESHIHIIRPTTAPSAP